MNGDELSPVGEGPLDLNLVDHLGNALHHIVPFEDSRAEPHEFSDGFSVPGAFENFRRDQADRLGIVELDAPVLSFSGKLGRDENEELFLLSWG